MRVVNIRELKARLSAYLRDVQRGEAFLVTDRNRVVARLGPPSETGAASATRQPDALDRITSLGCRPPLRDARPTDYQRPGRGPGLSTQQIDSLLDWVRGEQHG